MEQPKPSTLASTALGVRRQPTPTGGADISCNHHLSSEVEHLSIAAARAAATEAWWQPTSQVGADDQLTTQRAGGHDNCNESVTPGRRPRWCNPH